MMLFSSLTNRIFFGSALLAIISIGVAIYNVNIAVTAQAEQELRRGVEEAGAFVDEYRRLLFDHFSREARLVADLPRLKATVDTNDPLTVEKLAIEYRQQLAADLLVITGAGGRELARVSSAEASAHAFDPRPAARTGAAGREASSFWPHRGGILQVVSVPIWINPLQPEVFGTLSLGFSLDDRAAARFGSLTNSEIAFGFDRRIYTSTLPESMWPSLVPLLERRGATETVTLDSNEYIAATWPLLAPKNVAAEASEAGSSDTPVAIVLRSRTERLRFLNALHRTLAGTAIVALLAAVLVSYAIARTVTRPLGTITATMREMAATGDLTRRIDLARATGWQDEDARLLATTFNSMTDSISRFQREAAQRERLSSLGRLSTVVAHEVRNPLMIIKTTLRGLKRPSVPQAELETAVKDIDEEVSRLNRIVSEVLDFARPIKFEYGPADLNALCRDAVKAVTAEEPAPAVRLQLDPSLPGITTDAERLRMVLVNVLTNARHAVEARKDVAARDEAITVITSRRDGGRVSIEVRDRGVGISAEDLPRVFDPYFTTRRAGTGLGLAISRNIIEGLGGAITVVSTVGVGTHVTIQLPLSHKS